MITNKHQVLATTAQAGKVAMKDNLAKRVDRFQTVGIDEHLVYIRTAGS